MIIIAKRLEPVGKNSLWGELVSSIRSNGELVILSLFLLAGMAGGAVYARYTDSHILGQMDFLFAGDFKARIAESYLSIFTASFASSFLFLFACFLCGLSMWGIFMIPLVLAFRGFGMGLTAGYLYAFYGGKGILFNLCVMLPGATVCCLALLFASREGIRLSRRLAGSCGSPAFDRTQIRIYLLHFGAALSIAFAAALIDLLLSVCFGSYFSF